MKPTPSKIDNNQHGDSFVGRAAPGRFPLTDYNYQVAARGPYDGGHAGRSKSSFLSISRNYFRREARWSFAGEIFFFALVIATVAVAFIIGTSAIVHFLRLPTVA